MCTPPPPHWGACLWVFPAPPLGESLGCRSGGCGKGPNPKENRVRGQTGRQGQVAGGWPQHHRQRHQRPKHHKVPFMSSFPVDSHTTHTLLSSGPGGGRGPSISHPHLSPHSGLISTLPEHLLEAPGARHTGGRHQSGLIPRGDKQAHTVSDGVVCACKDRGGKAGLGVNPGSLHSGDDWARPGGRPCPLLLSAASRKWLPQEKRAWGRGWFLPTAPHPHPTSSNITPGTEQF